MFVTVADTRVGSPIAAHLTGTPTDFMALTELAVLALRSITRSTPRISRRINCSLYPAAPFMMYSFTKGCCVHSEAP